MTTQAQGTMKERVAALYAGCSRKDRAYFNMKWRRGNVFELCESLLPRHGTIIDVGCGTGILANTCSLAEPGRKILGLDLDPHRVAVAQSTVGQRTNIEFRVQRLEDVDIEDDGVDGVIVMDVIHHINIDTARGLFTAIHDMLKPGGVFLLKDIDRKPRWKFLMNYAIDSFNTLRKFTLGNDLVFRDPAEIQADLEALGFRVERPALPGVGTCPHALYRCVRI